MKEKRNYGIDLLRVLSMLYVVILHTLKQGGILDNAVPGSGQYQIAWLLESWCLCAVNIFGMISGYVGYTEEEKPHRVSGWLMMWLQVVFYGVTATAFFAVAKPGLVQPGHFLKMFFPVSTDLYWYFTAYTALFLLIPLLNSAVRHCGKPNLRILFVALILVFSVFDSFADVMRLARGYSFGWLMILYLLGAIIKKCGIGSKLTAPAAAGGIVLSCLLCWLWKLGGVTFDLYMFRAEPELIAAYPFPFHVLSAICHVLLFSRLRFGDGTRKAISFMASGAFAVYLLNTQRFVWSEVMENTFVHLASRHPAVLTIRVVLFAAGFVAVALLLDGVRRKLFAVLRIKQRLMGLEDKLTGKESLVKTR